jgi:AraC-like DNA-binding protein
MLALKKIPVYNIQTISCKPTKIGLIEILPFEEHLKNTVNIHFPHRHDFYYLLFITAGKGTHTIDFKTYPVKPNQLFFMSPGQVHQWDIKPNTKGFTLFFDKELFTTQHFNIEKEWPFFQTVFNEDAFLIPKQKQAELNNLFSLVLKESLSTSNNQKNIVKNLVSALLYKINDLVSVKTKSGNSHQFELIRRFELMIDKHYMDEHQLDFYATKLAISPNYLNAICKKAIDKSAKQLINERLILEAKRLLSHTSMPINVLSDHLNFASSSYFIRFFKKMEGMTPQNFKTLE